MKCRGEQFNGELALVPWEEITLATGLVCKEHRAEQRWRDRNVERKRRGDEEIETGEERGIEGDTRKSRKERRNRKRDIERDRDGERYGMQHKWGDVKREREPEGERQRAREKEWRGR